MLSFSAPCSLFAGPGEVIWMGLGWADLDLNYSSNGLLEHRETPKLDFGLPTLLLIVPLVMYNLMGASQCHFLLLYH